MQWEQGVAWFLGGVMVVIALVIGANIWISAPVVTDGVLNVSRLVIHLIGSTLVGSIVVAYHWALLKK